MHRLNKKKETAFKIGCKSDLYSLGKIIESINFKKFNKLKGLVRKLLSNNPCERPELKEIRTILKSYKKSKPLYWVMILLVIFILSLLSILLWKSKDNNNEPTSLYVDKTDSIPTIIIYTQDKPNLPLQKEDGQPEIKNSQENLIVKHERDFVKNKGNNFLSTAEENEDKKEKRDVHPLEIITYDLTLGIARKNYNLYPDSVKDWKNTTQIEVQQWLNDQINNDEVVKVKCLEAMGKGLTQFESTIKKSGSY